MKLETSLADVQKWQYEPSSQISAMPSGVNFTDRRAGPNWSEDYNGLLQNGDAGLGGIVPEYTPES